MSLVPSNLGHPVLELFSDRSVLADLLHNTLSSSSSSASSLVACISSIFARVLVACPPVSQKTLLGINVPPVSSTILNILAFSQPETSSLLWKHLVSLNIQTVRPFLFPSFMSSKRKINVVPYEPEEFFVLP
jgi:hypothetical protein